ncbi:MAG: hypothetical protein O7J95_07230 [Planctomycetota bacterium]|nr:hypothetical protein [Planctomycetota bacterium]
MDIIILIIILACAVVVLRTLLRKGPASPRRRAKRPAVEEPDRQPNLWIEIAGVLGLHCDLGGSNRPLEVTGGVKGNRLHFDSFAKRSRGEERSYIRMRVVYPGPLGLGLRLSREGALSRVARHLGDEDIEVGDENFDEDVVVKSSDVDEVISFLTPARRLRTHRLLMLYPGLIIGDSEITWTFPADWATKSRLLTLIRRVVHVVRHLTADREDDRPVNEAVKARQEGRIEEAVKIVREIPPDPESQSRPLENMVLEGEMLYVAGHHEEAHQVFEAARAEAPEDPEIQEWAERSDTSLPTAASENEGPPPLPGEAVKEGVEEGVEEEEKVLDIDVESLCRELFDPKLLSLDTDRLFDEGYKDRTVCWSGVLESAECYPFDFVFGSEPGTKAVIDLFEFRASLYATKKILGVVQLPPEACHVLKPLVGTEVAFKGRLHSVDGFVHNLYITGAELVSELAK